MKEHGDRERRKKTSPIQRSFKIEEKIDVQGKHYNGKLRNYVSVLTGPIYREIKLT